jgi:hypothetical protein
VFASDEFLPLTPPKTADFFGNYVHLEPYQSCKILSSDGAGLTDGSPVK